MIYLDHAATSWPKPPEVLEEIERFLTEPTANAGRGHHQASVRSTRLLFETRKAVAQLLGAPRANDLVFTRGATEAINLVVKGLLRPGDRVLVSPMEHNAVMRPLARLQADRNIEIETLPADPWGRIDLAATAQRLAQSDAALVAVAHGANVNGVTQDLVGLRQAIGKTPLLVDAAQTAGVLEIDIRRQGIDFLALSAHKGLLGPTGVGLCYLSPRFDIQPLCEGGTGSQSELLEHPQQRPDRYEAGTLNLHGIAGLWGALRSFQKRGLLGEEKRRLTLSLIEGLRETKGVRIVSPDDGSALLVSLTINHLSPEIIAERLEEKAGILCRSGLHCAPCAHRHLGTFPDGALRLSPGWGTTEAEIETAVTTVRQIAAEVN